MPAMDRGAASIDVAVIGAGVTGLASARAIARDGRSVCVLERHPRPGLDTSTRNSGVIHAGIYHPSTGSSTRCLTNPGMSPGSSRIANR
jgi:L-2-hydroxyglutarate oxidase LhgO